MQIVHVPLLPRHVVPTSPETCRKWYGGTGILRGLAERQPDHPAASPARRYACKSGIRRYAFLNGPNLSAIGPAQVPGLAEPVQRLSRLRTRSAAAAAEAASRRTPPIHLGWKGRAEGPELRLGRAWPPAGSGPRLARPACRGGAGPGGPRGEEKCKARSRRGPVRH